MNDESKILKMVDGRVAAWTNSCVGEAERYTREMNEDYGHFFCRHSGDMYKVQRLLEEFDDLGKAVSSGNLDEVKEHLRHKVEYYSHNLRYGAARRRIPVDLAGVAHLLNREVTKDVVRRYKHLLALINGKEAEADAMEQGKKIAG